MDRWRCIISSIPGGADWRTLVESRAEQFRCRLKHPWDSLKLHRRQLPRQLQAGFLPFKQCPTGEGNQRRASCHSSVRNMSHVGTWKTGHRGKSHPPGGSPAWETDRERGLSIYCFFSNCKNQSMPCSSTGAGVKKRRLKEVTLQEPLRVRPRVPKWWAKVKQLERENGFSHTHLLIT